MDLFSGKQKIKFRKQLGINWLDLADYFEIEEETRNRFVKGDEASEIWAWLNHHDRLGELYEALNYIDRKNIVVTMQSVVDNDNKLITAKPYAGNPFPGLRAFTEKEHSIFFGRNPEIKLLLERVTKTRFLAVIGPSGSGKSSLVRAGLLSNLKQLPGGEHWIWLRFTPGGSTKYVDDHDPDPFKAFAFALGTKLETENLTPVEIARQLYNKGNVADIVQSYLDANPQSKELLLFIDQFEELFTLVNDQYRQRFIAMLEKAAQCENLRVIITVRADFYEQCLNYPALARLINQGAWHLASPDLSALWQMITFPAKAAGIDFEEGLADQILNDTGSGSGALALMAFALKQLYQQCKPGLLLSCEAYHQIGGVCQAIGHRAEAIYQSLDSEAQAARNTVFAELITVDPERRGIATRRPAAVATLCATAADKRLFDAFTNARLFVTDTINPNEVKIVAADGAIVEVAHEALFTHWPLLKDWITARFDDFCLLRQVRMEAAEWERNGRAASNLWPHERLQKVYDMQKTLKPQLSASVCAFIRPEANRLLEKLNNPALTHQQRERIGVRLAEIGDPRPGVGVDKNSLPDFEWCEVPPGRIELEDSAGTFDVTPFFISKYPVTFKQYRAFLEADDGYRNDRWWTDLHHETEPGEQFRKIDNHPAETLSWFDAMAFCRWLSDVRSFDIRLPTEWEWQQAATGGNPENVFPWGKDFETGRCNNYESALGRTTAVGLYLNGESPVGALDMSGNVWEWCSNSYENPKNIDISIDARRVVRGASWYVDQDCARASRRYYYTPGDRNSALGFRVVCSSPIVCNTEH